MSDYEWQGKLWLMLMVVGTIGAFIDGYPQGITMALIYSGVAMLMATLFMLMISAITFIGNGFDHQ